MKEMNSLQRVQTVLNGEIPDRLPVIPQSFLFAVSHSGYSIGKINRNPAQMAQCHIECREKFGYDGCVMDVDDAALAEACGAKVTYREGGVAAVEDSEPVLEDLRDIDSLHMPNPKKDGRLPEWLETTHRIAEKIGKEAIIIGRGDQGPFNLLCMLRGTQEFMMDLLTEEEEVIYHALEWTTKAHIAFAKAQIEAGAHISSMGDSYASPNLVSPEIYEKYALPYEKEVVRQVQTPIIPYSVHICGDTNRIIEKMGTTGAKILEIDWKVDMGRARKVVDEHTVLMGNVNPSDPLYTGTEVQVQNAVKKIITDTKGKGIIVSSGCAMGDNTKPENVAALVEAVKEYGSYERVKALQETDL